MIMLVAEKTSVKSFVVEVCGRNDIKEFIEKWHYSKSINGLKIGYCFRLMREGEMIGAMIYGEMAMANAYKKYEENEKEVVELRRLCCIDDTPKNTESYFIGATLRWLKSNSDVKTVVFYADPEYNHVGTIYKATNFSMIGMTSRGRVIITKEGKRYHDKAIRTKHKGVLKPFAQRLVDQLDSGDAFYKNTQGKYIYVYKLKG